MEWELTHKAQQALLKLARETLVASFQGDADAPEKDFEKTVLKEIPSLGAQRPCFVTLYFGKTRHLRGCIGVLSTDQALYQNVAEYVQHAAFSDPRFPPLGEDEIKHLKIGISVLGPEHPLKNLEDIEIGKHGLVIKQGRHTGVLLAKVAVEENWNKQEFLRHTCQKAGLPLERMPDYEKFYFKEISFEES